MRPARFCCAAFALVLASHAATFSVYSGASYQPVVAPNSWAVAFGSQMASTTAIATLSSSAQWPTTLGGVTVQVDGQPAELYYVSPGQINFLIPDLTDFGSVNVVITNSSTGSSLTSAVNLQNTAVAIFSAGSTGSGPAAILNGVTNAGPPFLVVTPQNGGSDLRTRLAVYCTGLRYAGNPSEDPSITNVASEVTALGIDTTGNQYNFAVEYAGGSDPAFPGLDQVNIVLPAQLDGAGVVTLTISAENATSNKVTFQVTSLPANQITLTSLALSTSETIGGTPVTGTLSLNGVARTNGFPVSIRNSNPNVTVPPVVTIPQGQASTTFSISTPSTSTVQKTTITAVSGSVSLPAALQIDPSNLPQLTLFTATPTAVQGGANLSVTVGLTQSAPAGGVTVQLASSDTVAQSPASVTVMPNNTTATVSIPTTAVTISHTVTLTATLGNTSLTQQVTVVPPIQVSVTPSSLTGGAPATGTVTLGTVAPAGGRNVALSSNGTAFVTMPAVVNVPAGQFTASFAISTMSVTSAHTVTITASAGSIGSATASLTVDPPSAGQLQSLSVNPSVVGGGSSATGTVTLSGPAQFGGVVVTLKSSNPLVATVPFNVTVPQGSTTATFTATTFHVASSQNVTITATVGGASQTATLTVQ